MRDAGVEDSAERKERVRRRSRHVIGQSLSSKGFPQGLELLFIPTEADSSEDEQQRSVPVPSQ